MSVEQLVQAIESCQEADLQSVEHKIADYEKRLVALQQLKKLLRVRLGLEEAVDESAATKKRGRKPGSSSKHARTGIKLADTVQAISQEQKDKLFDEKPNEDREKIYDLLIREGSLPVSVIAKKLGFTWQKTRQLIQLSDWFTKIGRDTEDSEADIEVANYQRLRDPAPKMHPADRPSVVSVSQFSKAPKGQRLVQTS